MNQNNPVNRHIVDHLTMCVLVFDDALRLVQINPAAEMLFGVSGNKALGKSLKELAWGNGTFSAILKRALETGRSFVERELEIVVPHQGILTVDCAISAIVEPGYPRQLLVEMTSVDRQIRISKDEHLLSQQQATRDLLRGLAHEIKNPLGGLRGAAQLLERQFDSDELKEYTQIIINEADRLQNLVDRMLGPRKPPEWKSINLHEATERVYQIVSTDLPKGVRIDRDYDPSIPELRADADLLIQAILNIVNNAISAVGEHGIIRIQTRTIRKFTIGQMFHKLVACIKISDTGPGIPKELQETIFYPMISHKDGGTGLGLSIAQSLINQHGGLIEVDSEPGKTEFTILIPLETKNG